MIETATFTCSICSEPSTAICVDCTKDACDNHRCERCHRCSDCCECDVPLTPPQQELAQPALQPPTQDAHVPAPGEPSLQQPDEAWLAPPEATEEPDLNTPPAPVLDQVVEQEQHAEKARPFPTNSARDVPDGAD